MSLGAWSEVTDFSGAKKQLGHDFHQFGTVPKALGPRGGVSQF